MKTIPHAYIKLRPADNPNEWYFLKYDDPEMSLIEKRMIITKDFSRGFVWYGIIYTFPLLNENGIDSEIEHLKLAKKALQLLKDKKIPMVS